MVEFDNLPPKSRSLILATLGLEMASANCNSIFELARKRFQTVPDVWRDVCKKTGQPRCTMPARVMGTEYAAIASASEAKNAAAATTATANAATPAGNAANVSVFVETPAPAKPASPVATPAPAATVKPAPHVPAPAAVPPMVAARRAPPAKKPTMAVAIGIAAVLLLGIGVAVFAIPRSAEKPNAAAPTTVIRATNEPTRTASDKPAFDPNSVAPPEGTVRRLDAIKGSFSKQK